MTVCTWELSDHEARHFIERARFQTDTGARVFDHVGADGVRHAFDDFELRIYASQPATQALGIKHFDPAAKFAALAAPRLDLWRSRGVLPWLFAGEFISGQLTKDGVHQLLQTLEPARVDCVWHRSAGPVTPYSVAHLIRTRGSRTPQVRRLRSEDVIGAWEIANPPLSHARLAIPAAQLIARPYPVLASTEDALDLTETIARGTTVSAADIEVILRERSTMSRVDLQDAIRFTREMLC